LIQKENKRGIEVEECYETINSSVGHFEKVERNECPEQKTP